MAKNVKYMSEIDKAEIIECLESKMTFKEIHEKTGRSYDSINKVKKGWKAMKKEDTLVEPMEPAKKDPKTDIANSDYAKAYLSGDARWKSAKLNVEKSIKISSATTSIEYNFRKGESKSIQIKTPDGASVDIPIEVFDKFADELIDVYIEVKEFCK